jgi:hypothetical protein
VAAIQIDPLERRGRKERLQAHFGRLGKTLPDKRARLGLTRRIGQGRRNMAHETRVFLADLDLDPHKAPTRHPRAMTGERGPFANAHSGRLYVSGNTAGNHGRLQACLRFSGYGIEMALNVGRRVAVAAHPLSSKQ